MSLADKITIEQHKIERYSDFTNEFLKNPVTGYLAKVTNEESVKQSIKNLILTRKGERFYNSAGSLVMDSLFNPMDTANILSIKYSITDTINNFEPRAELLDVVVTPYEDTNSVFIKIIFSIKNTDNSVYAFDLIVSRTR